MSTRFGSALLTAAAVLLAAGSGRADRPKPVRPPGDGRPACPGQEAGPDHSHCSMCLGPTTDGNLVITLKDISAGGAGKSVTARIPLSAGCPLVGKVVKASAYLSLGGYLGAALWAECGGAREDVAVCPPPPDKTAPKDAPADCTCPYLRQQARERNKHAADNHGPEHSVLENLERLEKARRLYRQAEFYRRVGKGETAARLYEKVQRLCPGSRYDRKATGRLQVLHREEEVQAPAGEEQEAGPEDREPPRAHTPSKKVEQRVGHLLEAAQAACRAGEYVQAWQLAEKALQLDADCVAAHPLVYKMHLLNQIQEHCVAMMLEVPFLGEMEAGPETTVPPPALPLCPPLPAVDPMTVGDLDRLLPESAAPPDLPGSDGAGPPDGTEEQEDPPTWPSPPAPGASANPQVSPDQQTPEDLAAQDTPEEDEEGPDMNNLLREVIQAVGGEDCLEIDTSREDCLRARCELEVNGVRLELTWTEDGAHGTVVPLPPAPGAEPQARPEGVLDWLQSLPGEPAAGTGQKDADLPPG
jgi:hypothetical protein